MYNNNRSLKWLRNRVKVLKNKPQPPQRSQEWFKARNQNVTGSDAACCLTLSEDLCKDYVETFNVKNFKYRPDSCMSHFDTKNDYIEKKCRTYFGENLFKDNIFTLHGKKFEEIATRLYRIKLKTDVIEFGLLPHSRLGWLSASPDGITTDGVMVEIKCPYSRKISEGNIPIHYWCQIQIQLETADLEQCDFLECEIKEITEDDFFNKVCKEKQDIGILLNKISLDKNDESKYIYPLDNISTQQEYIEWKNQIINENKEIELEPIYYFIEKWNVLSIFRNKMWFEKAKPYLKKTIDFVRILQNDKTKFDEWAKNNVTKPKKKILEFDNSICLIENNIFDELEATKLENTDTCNDVCTDICMDEIRNEKVEDEDECTLNISE